MSRIRTPDYSKMSAEDYSKLTSDQWAKMTPPLVGDGYAKLTDHNWNQSYGSGGHPGQTTPYHHPHSHHPHAHPHHLAVANNEYAHQMQAGGYANPSSKYWA